MTGRYAIRGVYGRRGGALMLSLRFLLVCTLIAVLTGCRSEATKEETPALPAGTDVVQAAETQPAVSDANGPGAKITVEKPVLDLGDIGTDSKVSGKFSFTSSGTDTLKIVKVHSCCGVTIRGVEAGQEYAPGKTGVLEFDYVTGSTPLSDVKRELRFQTNDPDQKFVSLTIKANIVRRVDVDPKRLRLFLKQENAGCGDITVRSLDGKAFSIRSFRATANSISADFDPNATATEFVLNLKADMEKLQKNVRGVISIDLTHPECGNVRVPFDVLPEFTVNPVHLMLFNMRPGQPMPRDVWVLSNYRDDFEVESVSSQKGYVTLVEKKKVGNRYLLRIEVVPPAQDSEKDVASASSQGQNASPADTQNANTMTADMLEVKIKDGDTLSIPIRGFYLVE
ncbi:MAG: DUF1573 domain-containing protein [Phycisphaerales bacterium]